MATALVHLIYQSWLDLDQATEELSSSDTESRHLELSRIAWTVGHVTQQVDSWFNVRFQGIERHPVIGSETFHTGASGDSPPWSEVSQAIDEVRQRARVFLEQVSDADMTRIVPYDGGIDYLRETGLRLDYALMRTSAHHFLHTGEILTIRSLLQKPTSDSWPWGIAFLAPVDPDGT